MSNRQHNYVKSFRKRFGLNQRELGYLLGHDGNVIVSNIEQSRRHPNLRDMICLELLFGTPHLKLFPDLYKEVSEKLIGRINDFDAYLTESGSPDEDAHKQNMLRQARRSITKINHRTL